MQLILQVHKFQNKIQTDQKVVILLVNDPVKGFSLRNFYHCKSNCSILDLKFKIDSTRNGILLPNLFWPIVRKNFEITRAIYSNSERSEQILETECFFKLVPGGFSDLIN